MLYQYIEGEVLLTSIEIAEFVKHADNTWHAIQSAFSNEISSLCKVMNLDCNDVLDIFVQDFRFNHSAGGLQSGFAFDGSCLHKNFHEITDLAKELEVDLPLLNSIMASNVRHLEHSYHQH